MSMAENLRAWSEYLNGCGDRLFLEQPSLDLLRLVIEDGIIAIESLERPERLDQIAAKAARELAVANHADAIVDGVRSGKVSLLSRYRAGLAPCGGLGDGGAA